MRIHELGHVVLFVQDLDKMTQFYEEVLGFHAIGDRPGMAAFSSGRTHHELLLIQVGYAPKPRLHPEPGLYHIGLKIGDTDEELKDALKELKNNKTPILGLSDHTVTHSIYVQDPEGNEIELYVDINDVWKKHPEKVLSPVKPLKLK